ncbi:MAG: hypothetical protein KA020_10770 [Planctomycetes bacterium]|nr:hypothetical protein [Planctomycetota bacterium]
MRHESIVEQPLQSLIDFTSRHAESYGHPIATEEGRTAAIGGEGEQHQQRRAVRPEFRESTLM